jgi:hypothetical protein
MPCAYALRGYLRGVDDGAMHAQRAQATLESVVIVALVGAVLTAAAAGGAFAWLPPLVLRAAAVPLERPAASRLPADELAFLERALARPPSADGPLVRDAIARLAGSVGPQAARAIAIDHALRRYALPPRGRRRALADPSWSLARPDLNGVGPGTPLLWSEETPRAPSVLRLRTPADERRWRAAQSPTTAERVVEFGSAGIAAVLASINPATSAAAAAIEAGTAAAETPTRGIPSGSRDDDVVICRFVWRRNVAVPGWAAEHPVDALRLALGERLPAVELIVIRGGSILSRDVVRSHAETC